MPDYRIRYIVGYYEGTDQPLYHSLVVLSDEPPTEEAALDAASLHELHLYQEEGASITEIELDDIREISLAGGGFFTYRSKARYVYDYNTEQWFGPLFEGRANERGE